MQTNNTHTASPFTSTVAGETFSKVITEKSPVDLVMALISVALCFGIDRTESAIRATYSKNSADQIIKGMNAALTSFAA